MKKSTFFLMLTLMLGIIGYFGYEVFHKEYVTVKCPDCDGTGKASCGAPGCIHGTIPCPNPDCLQLTRGEWVHMYVKDHPDTDLGTSLIIPMADGRPTTRAMWATSFNLSTAIGRTWVFALFAMERVKPYARSVMAKKFAQLVMVRERLKRKCETE